ncbi:MAG: hypothetical protein ACLTBV_16105 [Enterocloster bolteae]
MELDYKAIGKRIKIQRIQREMTQEKLAELRDYPIPIFPMWKQEVPR